MPSTFLDLLPSPSLEPPKTPDRRLFTRVASRGIGPASPDVYDQSCQGAVPGARVCCKPLALHVQHIIRNTQPHG
jgi:hypothetical protein